MHRVMIVPAEQLDATRSSLKRVTGCHVYAVAPSSGGSLRTEKDALGAAVGDAASQVRAVKAS